MRKSIFIALFVTVILGITACSSNSENKITAVDGYIKDANLTDSSGQVGVYSSSGQYTFSDSIVYPLTLTGGILEDTNLSFDINMTAQEGAMVISPITTFLENNSTLLDTFINLGLGFSTLSEFSVDYISTNNSDLAKLSQLLYIVQKDTALSDTFKTSLIYYDPSSLNDVFDILEENVMQKINPLYVYNYLHFLTRVKDLDISPSAYEAELMTLKAGLDVNLNPVSYNNTIYEIIISPHTGRAWIDKNLGAYKECYDVNDTYCFGDYYQWGRNFDGHENSNSELTSILSSSITEVGVNFITSSTDWTTSDINATQRTLNWSSTDGSSICPVGYRVPTIDELKAEITSIDKNFLLLPYAGVRNGDTGTTKLDDFGALWSSTTSDSNSTYLYFDSSGVKTSTAVRSNGYNVRCIKD